MKYQSFKDLPIGLNDCSNVIHCLKHFIKLETIGQSINYLCLKCKRKSKAMKHEAHFDTHLSNILVLQLKLFNFLGTHGFKLSEHSAFDMQLDMSPFLS